MIRFFIVLLATGALLWIAGHFGLPLADVALTIAGHKITIAMVALVVIFAGLWHFSKRG